MTTIKFKRPDGEARLSWVPDEKCAVWGGWVRIQFDSCEIVHAEPDTLEYLEKRMRNVSRIDPSPILLAAEKLRNEKRKLLPNEYRGDLGNVLTLSAPMLEGYLYTWSHYDSKEAEYFSLAKTRKDTPRGQFALAWHRANFKPAADECYPPGELPRRMTDDEVRFPDGSAQKMVLKTGETRASGECAPFVWAQHHWWPGRSLSDMSAGHPARSPSQLARLQAFWDANRPKEAGLNLRWVNREVRFDLNGSERVWHPSLGWGTGTIEESTTAQRAAAEAFFAAGPPVELAEDEFVHASNGETWQMRRLPGSDDLLETKQQGAMYPWKGGGWTRFGLEEAVKENAGPLGWPRALAYFEKHVAKPEPDRVTPSGEVKAPGPVFEQPWGPYTGSGGCDCRKWYQMQIGPLELVRYDAASIEIDWTDPRSKDIEDTLLAACVALCSRIPPAMLASALDKTTAAALSDHIRRGDATKGFPFGSDEALIDALAGGAVLRHPDGSTVSATVTGEPGSYPKSWQAGYDAALAGLSELRENLGTASDAQIAHIARKVLRHGI